MKGRGGAFSLLACLAIGACATDEAARPAAEGGSGVATGPAAARGEIGRQLLPTADNGLELRRWRIADAAAEDLSGRPRLVDRSIEVAAALMKYADGEVLDEDEKGRLQRNGFRFVRVKADLVEALLAELGPATVDATGWHGQACDWREVAAFPVDPDGRAVAVDGRVRRFAGGRLRLMMRGWTMQMEDGPYLHLEVMPDYRLARPSRLEQALGRNRFQGERFPSMSLDLLTEAGYAYVLLAESPAVEWAPVDASVPGGEGQEVGPDVIAESEADEGERPPAGSRRNLFAAPVVGPDAVMPRTIGELLLRGESIPPVRHLLVFVPRIPDALFPPQTSAAVGQMEDES